MMYRRAQLTMQYLQQKVEEGPMPPGKRYVSQLSIVESDRLYDAAFMALLSALYETGGITRKEEIKYGTLYNMIVSRDVEGHIVKKRKRAADV